MKALSKATTTIFRALIARLGSGTHVQIGEKGSAIMPVVVEKIGLGRYSIAHYYEQNGDLMADPEVCFWVPRAGQRGHDRGDVYPISYKQAGLGIDRELVIFEDGAPVRECRRLQHDCANFCSDWFRNIVWQQNLEDDVKRARKAA